MIDRYSAWERAAIYAGMALFLVFILAPFAEALMVSLRPLDAVFRIPYTFFGGEMTLQPYRDMLVSVPGLFRYILNSFIVATAGTALGLVCVVPAAYAFARFRFRGSGALLTAFLSVNMIGAAVLIIPLFKIMLGLGILNTYLAMIIPGATFVVPTGIFLMRTYFMRIPAELEDAAYVDGASRLYTLRRVVLPLALPGMVVVAVTMFLSIYAQQFLFALTFNANDAYHTLPVGLFQFFGREDVLWNELMAASLVGILPVLVAYLFAQKYIVAGLTAGAVKQ